MAEKYYRPIATVERDGKQWEVIISFYVRTQKQAEIFIEEFAEDSKKKNYNFISSRIETH